MKRTLCTLTSCLALAHLSQASSHMDAPSITLDPAANTTDVYAFVSQQGAAKHLTVALSVYPHEEPGIGPNKYNFDDKVLYRIKVGTGASLPTAANPNPATPPTCYDFQFSTRYKNRGTIAQSYLGVIQDLDDAAQNLTQTYTVSKIDSRKKSTTLFTNVIVPPNNQGLTTPKYNQTNDGNNPAKQGVDNTTALDDYTRNAVASNATGYQVFAGQRDDGFYADVQSIFDLDFSFSGGNKPFDSQRGFNVHTIVLNIPMSELGGDQQVAGVWAETYRQSTKIIRSTADATSSKWVQVGRQGNPLFCEGLIAELDKNNYNRSPVGQDALRYTRYATAPELATILGVAQDRRVNRTDIAGIFIPDVIKVDLSTGPARLAGGSGLGAAADDAGFHRLGIFGGDTLTSTVQSGFGSGTLPGGWPNGRRFGDDVLDIAVIAVLSDLRTSPPQIFGNSSTNIDQVTQNDIGYNKVFPYAATPHNGRNRVH